MNDQDTVEYKTVKLGPIIDGLRVVREGIQSNRMGGRQRTDERSPRCKSESHPRGHWRSAGNACGRCQALIVRPNLTPSHEIFPLLH